MKCKLCEKEIYTKYPSIQRTFCSYSCKSKYFARKDNYIPPSRKGIKHSEITLKKFRMRKGERNPAWVGEKVTYRPLHAWVERILGKPSVCEFCLKNNLKGHSIHWANKSGQYKRVISDWLRLCVKCHKNYDLKTI